MKPDESITVTVQTEIGPYNVLHHQFIIRDCGLKTGFLAARLNPGGKSLQAPTLRKLFEQIADIIDPPMCDAIHEETGLRCWLTVGHENNHETRNIAGEYFRWWVNL